MSVPAAGVTPAASFELAGFEPQRDPPAILADDIDPKTGEFRTLTAGSGIADGMAQFLLTVQRGSGASVRNFGQRFREITHNDGRATDSFQSFAREALRPGVDSGTLRVGRVVTTVDPADDTQAETVIEYTDLLAAPKDPNARKTFSP